jgi:predicted nucleic acid-binding protein
LISADTSTVIALLHGQAGRDVEQLSDALTTGDLRMAPPVSTELYTRPLTPQLITIFATIGMLPITEGFWERAGRSRRTLLENGLKAKLADSLIAQCCIDADVALIARDGDYRHFAKWCGLKLAE